MDPLQRKSKQNLRACSDCALFRTRASSPKAGQTHPEWVQKDYATQQVVSPFGMQKSRCILIRSWKASDMGCIGMCQLR